MNYEQLKKQAESNIEEAEAVLEESREKRTVDDQQESEQEA